MNRKHWTITTAMAAATVFSMPVSSLAQTAPPAAPPTTAQQPAPPAAAPQQNPTDDAAKVHLTAARNTLSQLTQLPAAGQLQGEARAQVSQLINNFNEMITTKADWKASYAKVEANLDALLNQPVPDEAPRPPSTAGAVGTSGATGLDPAIRSKLMEFRKHLDKFEEVSSAAQPAAASTTTSPTTTTTTATQAPPTGQTPPTSQTPPAAQTPPQTPPTTPPAGETPPATPAIQDQAADPDPEQLLRHVEAIEVILGAQAAAQARAQTTAGGAVGTSGTVSGSTRTTITGSDVRLSEAQVAQLRTHLAELRRLIEKK